MRCQDRRKTEVTIRPRVRVCSSRSGLGQNRATFLKSLAITGSTTGVFFLGQIFELELCPIDGTPILGSVSTFLPTRLIAVVFSGDDYTITSARPVKRKATPLSTECGSFTFWPICTLDKLEVSYDVVIVIDNRTRVYPTS